MRRNLCLLMLAISFTPALTGQELLTLDTCHARAVRANAALLRSDAKRQQTANLEKAALWQMLPKVDATGGYLWMEKSVNLLSEEQQEKLDNLGATLNADVRRELHAVLDPRGSFGATLADNISDALAASNLNGSINELGQQVVDALQTDTRNMGVAAFTLTQPLYMGGKLVAAYRSARLLHTLSGVEYDREREATLVAVDEAYWQVVSVKRKKELAERYAALLDTLERNVQLAYEADMATKGDLAKVRVKHNEASMNLTKATNGLALAKMLLAQRCGMPLDADIDVASTSPLPSDLASLTASADSAYLRRSELRMLALSDSLAREGVRMAASSLKPSVALSGGYLVTNPNLFNGFSNQWGGTWMAGVAVHVPIAHVGGIYALKAAKAKRREVAAQTQEARQLIALQVGKLRSELELSCKKKAEAESNMEAAEENLRLATESYKEGVCSSSDLMMAQTAWLQAQTELADACIEIEMGRVYLRQALAIK